MSGFLCFAIFTFAFAFKECDAASFGYFVLASIEQAVKCVKYRIKVASQYRGRLYLRSAPGVGFTVSVSAA